MLSNSPDPSNSTECMQNVDKTLPTLQPTAIMSRFTALSQAKLVIFWARYPVASTCRTEVIGGGDTAISEENGMFCPLCPTILHVTLVNTTETLAAHTSLKFFAVSVGFLSVSFWAILTT